MLVWFKLTHFDKDYVREDNIGRDIFVGINVTLTARDELTRQCPQTTTFE